MRHRACEPEMLEMICEGAHARLKKQMVSLCERASQPEQQNQSAPNAASSSTAIAAAAPAPLTSAARAKFVSDLKVSLHNFWLFKAAIEELFSDTTAGAEEGEERRRMEKHIVRISGLPMVLTCLRLEAAACRVPITSKLRDDEQRATLVALLPEPSKAACTALLASLKKGHLGAFESAFKEYCILQDISMPPLDKKLERQMVQGHRQGFLAQLEAEKDVNLALHLACVALFAFHFGRILNIPSRCLPIVLQKLVLSDASDADFLASFAKRVLAPERDEKERRELEVLLPQLRELVVRNKKLKKKPGAK